MATRAIVEEFLRDVKVKMTLIDISFRPRAKNIDSLVELDITPNERISVIKNLKVEDYYTGPNKDTHDTSAPDYFEFGINYKGNEIYIKLSLGRPNKDVDCMSFHKAERTITYPFK